MLAYVDVVELFAVDFWNFEQAIISQIFLVCELQVIDDCREGILSMQRHDCLLRQWCFIK